MSESETKKYDKEYVVHSWSVQSALDPLVLTRTKGVHMWDENGKRFIDMTSQLMNQNIGHQHPKVVQSIKDQADKLCFVQSSTSSPVRLGAGVSTGDGRGAIS